MTKARLFLQKLNEAGYVSYFAGGCVRDKLIGLPINDEDIATSATPEQVKEVLKDVASDIDFVGARFGVTICDGVEIAMFRSETYLTKSKPEVSFVSSPQEDAARRDYTINSLFEDLDGNIVDYFGGIQDLQNKIIRAVGDPHKRIDEDPSRILRGVLLKAVLDFEIEENTLRAIKERKEDLKLVPNTLKGKYILKSYKRRVLHKYMRYLAEYGLLEYVIPELVHTIGLPQNPKYHHLDVWNHILRVVQTAEERNSSFKLVMASLLHDNAKGLPHIRGVNKYGQPNDIGHEFTGVQPAKNAILRLDFGKDLAEEIGFLVKFHGIRTPVDAKHSSFVSAIKKMSPYAKNKDQLREKMNDLFQLMEFDATGFTPAFSEEMLSELPILKKRFEEALESHIYYRDELPVNGEDLLKLGFEGKAIGELLQKFVEQNFGERDQIRRYLQKKYGKILA